MSQFKWWRWLPMMLWMGFIFYLSSRQTTGIGHTYIERFLILKTFHLIEYGVLFILSTIALGKEKVSLILTYLYAVSDELHQSFVPGRTGKFEDTIIDLAGIMLAWAMLKLAKKYKPFEKLWLSLIR